MSANDDVPMSRELCRAVAPTGCAIIAFALSFIGCVQCNAIKFTSTSGFDNPVTIQFGFWSHEDVEFLYGQSGTAYMVKSCTSYQDVEIDTRWRVAAIFSILPIVIGGIDFLYIAVKKCTLNHVFDCVAFLLAFLFSALSLMFLDSSACKNNTVISSITSKFQDNVTFQETCSMSTGMNGILAASCFWFVAAFASADAIMAKRMKGAAPVTDLGEATKPMDDDTLRESLLGEESSVV